MEPCLIPVCWLVWTIGGAIIGSFKGRGGEGAAWGFLLGPFGWFIIANYEDIRRKCPSCRGLVSRENATCWHCRANLSDYQQWRDALDREREQNENIGYQVSRWFSGLFTRRIVIPHTKTLKAAAVLIDGQLCCPGCKVPVMVSMEMGEKITACPKCSTGFESPLTPDIL